ncbi:hypothetical protein YDYSY3_42090 [Paenibacillus chitinolyticus]|uniref:hypothetical protein n=1 Tax=Paenibacillus chitinolyticus TaxID=79263 RepID=UPI0026E49BE6|nr:hypothetical protein [Paenibacillus chitinolyticus]GKS13209.1 hypothetical protein YDYSY3_42090 [Paenibacillus chitinolyticus]
MLLARNFIESGEVILCAEHAAVAEMLKQGEYRIKAFVAADPQGNAVPPCGRCRELISQLSKENLEAVVEVENDMFVLLKDILPYDWKTNRGREWNGAIHAEIRTHSDY